MANEEIKKAAADNVRSVASTLMEYIQDARNVGLEVELIITESDVSDMSDLLPKTKQTLIAKITKRY